MAVTDNALGWGSTTPSALEIASGDTDLTPKQPAYFWALLVGLLVFARWLYENGEIL
jgi:hypothetical protein